MISAHFALMLLTAVCLLVAACGYCCSSRPHIGWLGMFFWALDLLIR